VLEDHPYKAGCPTGRPHLVFISHAGEQKKGAVADLLKDLESHPALKGKVFVDEWALKAGQLKPVKKICECLQDAFVGKHRWGERGGWECA
jgi:hypothetical protein